MRLPVRGNITGGGGREFFWFLNLVIYFELLNLTTAVVQSYQSDFRGIT